MVVVVAVAVHPGVIVTAAAVVAAVFIVPGAVLVVIACAGPHQRRVAHAANNVLHAGSLGAEVLIRESVQVKGGQGQRLGGSVGVEV